MKSSKFLSVVIVAFSLILLLALWGGTFVGAATVFSDNFEDGNANGWSKSSGTWSVVSDGSYVFKQASTSATCYAYTGSSWTNYTVQARVKPLSFNGSGRTVSLCARFSSTSNFYALTLSNTNTLSIQKKVGGTTSALVSKTYTVQTGTWYTLKVAVSGSSINAYVNGNLELSATDSSLASGKVGFAMINASAEFDDIVVEDAPAPSATVTPTATTTATVKPTATPTATATPPAVTATPTATPKVTATPTTPPVANAYYVAPNGSDSNPGTMSSPFLTLTKADSVAGPGTTIYLRGGTYYYSATVNLRSNGSSGNPIKLWAYPGEKPIIDFSAQAYNDSNRGIYLKGSYWHFKGIEEQYAGDNGIIISGSYNIIELCVAHGNKDAGIQIASGGAYNKVINCDAYDNYDPASVGGNADGFACKLTNGDGNEFEGCRAWHNSDDGWDLFDSAYPVKITNCWAFNNGYDQGNGNGIKVGGNYNNANIYVANCLAFNNLSKGFDQNHNLGVITLYNNTAWHNGRYNFAFYDTPASGQNVFINNISFEPGLSDQGPQGTWIEATALQQNNSWQGFTVTGADFASLDASLALAPRNSDGSLPNVPFLRLASGSGMINAGRNVGLPYNGSAPDLGAFETGN